MPCGRVSIDFCFLDQLHHGALKLLIKEFEKEANLVQFLCLKFAFSNSERPGTRALQHLPRALKVPLHISHGRVEKV